MADRTYADRCVFSGHVCGATWRINYSRHPVDTATVGAADLTALAIAVPLLMALGAWWWKAARKLWQGCAHRSKPPRPPTGWRM
jgi:hypothetical protein